MLLALALLPTGLLPAMTAGPLRCPTPHMLAAPRQPAVYIRDVDDASLEGDDVERVPVDAPLVEALVAERAIARAGRDYETADALKARLADMGVRLVDTPGREAWFVTARRTRGLTTEQVEGLVVDVVSEYESAKLDFASRARGHDYVRVGGPARGIAGQTSLGRVDKLLRQRVHAKREHDYARADSLLAELASLGVAVSDERRKWRSDGKSFAAAYERVPGDGDARSDELDLPTINTLLADRAVAKTLARFGVADGIAATLRAEHDVIVDDRRSTWRVVAQHGGFYRVGPNVDKAAQRIEGLLTKRSARLAKHGPADAEGAACLAKLHLLGVVLDERARTWSRPRRTKAQKDSAAVARGAGPTRAERRGDTPRSRRRSRSRPQGKPPPAARMAAAAVGAAVAAKPKAPAADRVPTVV